MKMNWAKSINSDRGTGVSTTSAGGRKGRICPSVCPTRWDKRKTPFASACVQATCEGRRKTKRRGQDSLKARLLLFRVCSNILDHNAFWLCWPNPYLSRIAHLGKRYRYKTATSHLRTTLPRHLMESRRQRRRVSITGLNSPVLAPVTSPLVPVWQSRPRRPPG